LYNNPTIFDGLTPPEKWKRKGIT